jgi:predicted DNA-binding protein
MTTTISIALGDELYARLRALAEEAGVSPEDLVRREVEEMIAQRREKFLRVAEDVLRKNAELYKRLHDSTPRARALSPRVDTLG